MSEGIISRGVGDVQRKRRWALGVRVILNGFPKSGLHLAEAMARCSLRPFLHENWIGDTDQGAWGRAWNPVALERALGLLTYMDMGTFVKGHLGYREEIVEMMDAAEIGMIFVFRDLRDVLCSTKRHLEQNGRGFIHSGRKAFQEIKGDEARLIALIEGFGKWGGLIERWEMYAPWLERDNVLLMPYEWMRLYPEEAAATFIRYSLGRAAAANGLQIGLCQDDLSQHVRITSAEMGKRYLSPTFVQGCVGGWKDEFTPAVKAAFKRASGDWLIRLGYEDGDDW